MSLAVTLTPAERGMRNKARSWSGRTHLARMRQKGKRKPLIGYEARGQRWAKRGTAGKFRQPLTQVTHKPPTCGPGDNGANLERGGIGMVILAGRAGELRQTLISPGSNHHQCWCKAELRSAQNSPRTKVNRGGASRAPTGGTFREPGSHPATSRQFCRPLSSAVRADDS